MSRSCDRSVRRALALDESWHQKNPNLFGCGSAPPCSSVANPLYDSRLTRFSFHFPRVKSGNFTGALPFATDSKLSGPGALHAAAS